MLPSLPSWRLPSCKHIERRTGAILRGSCRTLPQGLPVHFLGSNYADENIAGITTQAPGKTVLSSTDATSFALEVAADPAYTSSTGTGWTNLLYSGIGLSKSIINATNFQVSTGILTVDFDFMCYVG